MEYKIYKFEFPNGVHLGKTSLEDTQYHFCADTFFSALCHEAVKFGEEKLNYLVEMVNKDELLFSDAFPFSQDEYYLPKPIMHIESKREDSNKDMKKAFKKLKYISVKHFSEYLNGDYNISINSAVDFGKTATKVSASIRGEEETKPYRVSSYHFNEDNGLYIIVVFLSEEKIVFFDDLLESLSYSGIGGKRYSGFGRFTFQKNDLPSELLYRMTAQGKKYMSLSSSLPKEEELQTVINNASYTLQKRSGFILSETYADEYRRKIDLYTFSSGSCFNDKYKGDIYDVSQDGRHPVYRYAKPLFVEVDV